jgi:hypothetical protein
VVWDGSVLEKPESQKNEALCAVKSSKAARRKKSRKGPYNQAGGKPIEAEEQFIIIRYFP